MKVASLIKKEVMLKGLTCNYCAKAIVDTVKNIDGIDRCYLNFETKKLVIEIVDSKDEERIIQDVIDMINLVEPQISIEVLGKIKSKVNKKELILGGLSCAHCAQVIDDTVKNIEGIKDSNLNFINKKLTLQIDNKKDINQELIIEEVINLIDTIEPGLDIKVLNNSKQVQKTIKKELILEGLNCAHCAEQINDKVSKLQGVSSCNLNFVNKKLSLSIDNENVIKNVIDTINSIETGLNIYEDKSQKNKVQNTQKKTKLLNSDKFKIIQILLGVIIFIAGIGHSKLGINDNVAVGIFIVSYILVGYDVILKAFNNLKNGRLFDENFLMTVATVGAISIGEVSEAVGVILFYKIGEYLQELAVGKSRKSIADLMEIRPDVANLKVNNSIKVVDPGEVEIGDYIVVKPGEKVPLDGVIVEGKSMVDTSALTGESVFRTVKVGDELLSGFINKNSLLTVKVTKDFSESTVSKILDLVENASSKKSKTENFISVFCRYYTPIVVGLALLIAIIPSIFVQDALFTDWLHRALIFLVISCPCALVLSIPLSYFSGIGVASKKGILIKGSNYLEALRYVDTVVFDKTGTLTEGVFEVVKVYTEDISEEELIEYASIAEANSNHPIAKSILNSYDKEIDLSKINEYEEISAHGIKVKYENDIILAGNDKLMEANNIKFAKTSDVGTIVYVAVNSEYKGYIVIADKIKKDSKKAISDIKNQGIKKVIMLTGDNKKVAECVSNELELDKVYSELLPGQKVEKIEEIYTERKDNEKIAFVGDGINDAPVLARVDVGIAMGGLGSDAAIEAADIVIMTDEPSKIAEGIKISKRTNQIVWQNIILALGIKVIVMVLGTFGVATMWEAVFADVGVSIIAVINAMRIMK